MRTDPEHMRVCLYCGRENPAEASACNGCGTEFGRTALSPQPRPKRLPTEAPWTKLLNRLRRPIQNAGPPPYWTCNIALPKGVTTEAVVDFVFDSVRNKVPYEESMLALGRELGIAPDDCELALDRVWGGVFRARTGRQDNCPDQDTDGVAWTSYQKARTNPAIISEFYPPRPEEPQVPWTCPDCGEKLEAQFRSCWNCGGARPKADQSTPVNRSSARAQGQGDPWAERAQVPLPLSMAVVVFCLPLIVGLGWYCAADINHSYKTKGFARKQRALGRWFVIGMAFWVFLILLSWACMRL